jgi:hypothetical protein
LDFLKDTFPGDTFLGFPSGTTTPSSVILEFAMSGAVFPSPFVLHKIDFQ